MENSYHVAFDLGASSGRLVLGTFDGEKIKQEEMYRFSNTPVNINGTLYWDIPKLLQEIKNGLNVLKVNQIEADTLAIDTWGVDFGYLDENGELVSLPTHYRDEKKLDFEEELYQLIDEKQLFERTGVKPATINSILQLYTDVKRKPYLKDAVETVLFTPDLFNYFLTSQKNIDYTIASTSSLLSSESKTWDEELLNKIGIPTEWFKTKPTFGKNLGSLSSQFQEEIGINAIDVISASSHDTAATLLAIPKKDDKKNVFLSCGTWSVLGTELDQPITTTDAYNFDLTNEGCLSGNIRLLKNINGLWVLQQLQRYWSENGEMIEFSEMTKMAAESKTNTYLDTNDELFMGRNNMKEMIRLFCEKTRQDVPQNKGEMVRVILESLAMSYAQAIKNIEEITNEKIENINMFGGGIQNELLCQLTSDFSGKPVIAGPVEASSLGNIISQLLTIEKIQFEDVKEIIEKSVEVKVYQPKDSSEIEEKIEKYVGIIH